MNAPLRRLGVVIAILFGSLLISSTWVQFIDAPSLNDRPGNARSLYKELGRERGELLVAGTPIAQSVPADDEYRFLRQYPGGAMYAPVTGAFSIVYGSTGMEAAEGDLLSGTSGQLFYRRLGDLLTGEEPQGAAVELTIDPKVQEAAYDALGNRRGAVVALDPATGDVLAMVSRPSYDPNVLAGHNRSAVVAAYKKLQADEDEPLINRAIAGDLYPPGSTFKVITSAAALSSGSYTPQSTLPGPAKLDLPQSTRTLANDDSRPCGNGTVTLSDALRISCNTAFGDLGMKLGGATLAAQASKFGFGQPLSIPLRVTPSTFPADADQPNLAYASIGQYDDRVTPLQMAMVSAGVANKGAVMRPNLVRQVIGSDLGVIEKPSPQKLSDAVTSDVAAQLTAMMETVVQNGTGTRAQISGVRVAGKTGTAQHGAAGTAPHAWFTAFAPADAPRVAVAVVIEDGGGLGDAASGGRLAAPVAKKVIEAVLDR